MKQSWRSSVVSLSSAALITVLMGCTVYSDDAGEAAGQPQASGPGPVVVGEEVATDAQSPAYRADSDELALVWRHELGFKGATYIAPHFAHFSLPEGAYMVVRNPDTTRSRTYVGEGKPGMGEDGFWSLYMPGSRAILELYSKASLAAGAVRVDGFARGLHTWDQLSPPGHSGAPGQPDTEKALCGADDSQNAACYRSTEPEVYDKSRAVTRLMINGTSACTGWLVGSEGHVITNNHCIGTSSDAMNTTFDFMAEGATCSTSCDSWGGCPGTLAADGSTLVRTSTNLDYTLVLLPGNMSETHGYMEMRESGGVVGERIYIPQHPAAWGKRIAMTDGAGDATIASLDEPPCTGTGYSDVGYFADTQGGSSGSPVLGYSDHAVVALHHCANCPNRGVPIDLVIADLGADVPANAVVYACTPAAVASAGADQIACVGDVVVLGEPARADTTYAWSTGDTTAQIMVSPATTTTYTVTATTSCGSATDSVIVYVDDGTGGGMSDDFESGAGRWTMTGLWHLAADSSCASPGYASATHAMYYGQDATCNYSTGAATTGSLTSPAILGINSNSLLSFEYFRQVESYSGAYDQVFAEVSSDGISWATVWSRDSSTASENAWTSSGDIALGGHGDRIQIRFRFDSKDSVSNTFVGWLVDDVVVSGQSICTGGGANTAPVVNISSPASGAVFSKQANITFTGNATDSEDGDISAALTWTSDLAGAIGTGASFNTRLSPGIHRITASATDSAMASGSASITIEVTTRNN